jgi:hypothetical protein
MTEYTKAEKYKILKLNNYVFKISKDYVEWGFHHNQGYYWGGKFNTMDEAIDHAFEEWEKGV